MKRFLLFWFAEYYPSGGWHDLVDSFDSPVEATAFSLSKLEGEWEETTQWIGGDWQLIDGLTGEEINMHQIAVIIPSEDAPS